MAVNVLVPEEKARDIFRQYEDGGTMQYYTTDPIRKWAKDRDVWMAHGYIGFKGYPRHVELPNEESAIEFKLTFL